MSPILKAGPTPRAFADAWSKTFAEVVNGAAGKDGRLSLAEAKRIAHRVDGGKLWADNAVGWLETSGQKSVTASKLIAAGRAYAEASAVSAAGPDGRLSLADAKKLQANLQADFFHLRGRDSLAPVGQQPFDGRADLKARFDSALKDLWLGSESDARLHYLSAPGAGTGPVTEAEVRAAFSAAHDALRPDIYGYPNSHVVPLADTGPAEVRDAHAWLEAQATVWDPDDADAVATAARYKSLHDLVKAELTHVKLFRFGEVDISVMVVGRTRSGELAGFMSAVVET